MTQTILKVTDRDNVEKDLSMVTDPTNSSALVSTSIPSDPTSGGFPRRLTNARLESVMLITVELSCHYEG